MSLYILLPAIAIAALALASLPALSAIGLSALPLAILLGMVAGHLVPVCHSTGEQWFSRFSQQKLLRAGIILFGFSLNFQQIAAVGWQALLLDGIVISTTFLLGTWLGIKLFKLEPNVAMLTSVGSAICGAAAVMATEAVLKPKQRDVTVAVATVVLFGTLAMFSYPLLYAFSGMSELAYGIFIGSTVHEVAQAVAAGQAIGEQALQNAVIVKLMRVMLLAPFIVLLSYVVSKKQSAKDNGHRLVIPWFVAGFVASAGINTWLPLPELLSSTFHFGSQLSLAMAMAALGLNTRWSTIRAAGAKPLMLAGLLFVLLMVGGFGLNHLLIAKA
ncbi:YeiH family protein [Reinekea marinisedimentorum]|uniref:Putative integral membrane protein (TIGR00698 family) n=1 Tax=Reinekea marinisedimentorum TaxID=230495 RepID=A0A4R3HZZ3_9GAMM|nr:YeiH family protein [Reinekea marinisedimentorum]TCS38986.1 putative integral membrane protein (TIGR00698 family) [Reinekea marinisedimentorum]